MNNDQTRKKVQKLIQDRNYEGAQKVLYSMIKSDPANAANHSIMGDVLVKLEDRKTAIEHYEHAIKDYLESKLTIPALMIARKILRIDKNYTRAYFLMGEIYHSLEKKEQAETEFLKYLETIPSDDSDAIRIYRILSGYHPDDISWEKKLLENSDTIEGISDIVHEDIGEELHPVNETKTSSDSTETPDQPDTGKSGNQSTEIEHRSLSDASPPSISNYIDSGNNLFDRGDIYEAGLEYLKACRLLRRENREDLIFDLLDSILEIYPESITAAYELVRISKMQGAEKKETAFSRLLAAHILAGNFSQAAKVLERSLEITSDAKLLVLSDILGSNSGLIAQSPGSDFESSDDTLALDEIHDELYRKIDSIHAFYEPEICFENGIDAMDLELYEEAIDEFGKVDSHQVYRIRAKYNIALCFFYLEKFNDAEIECLKGLVLCSTTKKELLKYYLLLVDIFEQTSRHRLAEKLKETTYGFETDSDDVGSCLL